jgi:hypothetical protein
MLAFILYLFHTKCNSITTCTLKKETLVEESVEQQKEIMKTQK